VSYNRVFGYYIEVTRRYKDQIPEHYIRKQTLVNSERYISPQLKEYEAKVLGAEERIKNLEYELFIEIREQLYKEIEPIQQYVEVVAIIDVLANLAQLAYKNNYEKPEFNDDGLINIKQSRHPVIEKLLKNEEFIPNDIYLNDKDNQISLITGPNMAGKSTYLRQVGLLAIMAQMGSFIPVTSANMPIFDKVFTRVGASDNLAMGQSTFLVEMIEAANILNSATPDSLILLDEIGRGTSTFDGLSLAWSIVEYIHNNPKVAAKTLFATHYHELTELENVLPRVKNFNIVVKEWNDKIIFLRKIERGSADQSYGIQVARLAGVPEKVIRRAKQILHNLEEHEISPQGLSKTAKKQLSNYYSNQLDIFDAIVEKSEEKNEILETIKKLDVNKLTPIEAINKLSELKDKL
jgi:DNA mismatch repair protein MutS